ncbi:MAG: glycosyltransferase family 2 protein, partial [Promethearchaeota archaeon]
MEKKSIKIAVIIATCNRPFLLANRSLISVQKQIRKPDYVIVVDDSDKKNKSLNEEIVSEFRCNGTRIIYIENYRNKGASGAWNTAISQLLKLETDLFIAILDDDDEWDPKYLKKCEELVLENNLEMVISGIIRFDDKNPEGTKLTIPKELRSDDFLIGNPNIQGSNMFIELKRILEAGLFDESLTSTTDRDLCIRILDLGYVKIGFLREYLVSHYAFLGLNRLSTKGSLEKFNGLNSFYRKYCYRMNEVQKMKFIERANQLFGCEIIKYNELKKSEQEFHLKDNLYEEYQIMIGFITSSITQFTKNLLEDIQILANSYKNNFIHVIILENCGENSLIRSQLKRIIEKNFSFNLTFISLEKQKRDIDIKLFGNDFICNVSQKNIAQSRTMLQRYLYETAKKATNSIVWILDDDSRLLSNYWDKNKGLFQRRWAFFNYIPFLKKANVDIALCSITGAPPLPFQSCIRTQMVDFYHNMERLLNLNPNSPVENLEIENDYRRKNFPDYYYDLSRQSTSHLEVPFWYNKENEIDAKSLFKSMIDKLSRILCGEQVFRPILANPIINPLMTMIPSIYRGGNTIILNIETLNEFPNYIPNLNGSNIRRSDMVWCLMNRYFSDRKIVQIQLPISHDRSLINNKPKINFQKLGEDIKGYSIYSALNDILRSRLHKRQFYGQERIGRNLMAFSDYERREFIRLYRKYFKERFNAFEL